MFSQTLLPLLSPLTFTAFVIDFTHNLPNFKFSNKYTFLKNAIQKLKQTNANANANRTFDLNINEKCCLLSMWLKAVRVSEIVRKYVQMRVQMRQKLIQQKKQTDMNEKKIYKKSYPN